MQFYVQFASAYGTMMFVAFLASVLTQTHLNLGMIGFYGFPLVALIYAVVRYAIEENPALFARKTDSHPRNDQPIDDQNS